LACYFYLFLLQVADNQPVICGNVASNICSLLASTVQVAAGVALNTVAPGVGTLLCQIDFGKMVKSLIEAERTSRTPLPEYKFGGSLVLLYREPNHMKFVKLLGDGRVLENVFCVEEKDVTSPSLQLGIPQLKTFCQVINDLDNVHLLSAIKNASVDCVLSPKPDQGLSHIDKKVKDGAGRVVNSIAKSGKAASHAVQSAAR
jgi:hypothetical protein